MDMADWSLKVYRFVEVCRISIIVRDIRRNNRMQRRSLDGAQGSSRATVKVAVIAWVLGVLCVAYGSAIWAAPPVVRAVLFFSPTCPHCHEVMANDLPPLFEKYGERLAIIAVDVRRPDGRALYQAAIQQFDLTDDQRGIPTLIIGKRVLIGSDEIPRQLPGLVEAYLASGIDWPAIPGLAEAVAAVRSASSNASKTTSGAPSTTKAAGARPFTWRDRLAQDPVGNSLAIVVLVTMVAVLVFIAARFRRPVHTQKAPWAELAVPLLSLAGLFVAGYLTYVETAQVSAVCGPVGDCNTVQQSPYARLFGVVPVGMLGVLAYVVILVAWLTGRYAAGRPAQLATLVLFATTLGGTLFSIYLTFLEPFVIGATCAWCLASAVIITSLFWLSTPPFRQALADFKHHSKDPH